MGKIVSLDEFKKNVLLFFNLDERDKTIEEINFALDEIEKCYFEFSNNIEKQKIILTEEGYKFVYSLFMEEVKKIQSLRKNVELALRAIRYDEAFILVFDNIVKQDKRILYALADRKDYRIFFCLSEAQKDNFELMKEIITKYPSVFLKISEKLQKNKELKLIYKSKEHNIKNDFNKIKLK